MSQIYEHIAAAFASNQLLSGGFVLMAIGAAAAYLRSVPGYLWRKLCRVLFFDFEITASDEAFHWFAQWLAEQPYSKGRARWLSVKTFPSGREVNPWRVVLTPAPGTHWIWWGGTLAIVSRTRPEGPVPSGSGSPQYGTQRSTENYSVSLLTRDRSSIYRMIEEARQIAHPPGKDCVRVFTPTYSSWSSAIEKPHRKLESVVLREGVADSVVRDVDKFLQSGKWYEETGVPYRRGYLLYGPPGNGKSSLVLSLASHFRMSIYLLNLSKGGMTDDELRDLLMMVPEGAIVLMEDIDCIFEQRTKSDGVPNGNSVTFSGLLNAIDGVAASEGRLLFMTTNHIEKLDPALVRPGRCDVKVFIGDADQEQAKKMFQRFFPESELAGEFALATTGYSMAKLQGHLLCYRDSEVGAVQNIAELELEDDREVASPTGEAGSAN
jgi:mitochondrial chaperone BCS1